METITLQPGVWTRFNYRAFQPNPPAPIKIAKVKANDPAAVSAPDVETTAYVTNAGATERLITVADSGDSYFTAYFLMPVDNLPVTVIAVN